MTRTPEHAVYRLNEIVFARPDLAPVLLDVVLELLRAEGKFPSWTTDAAHAMNVLTEEVGELAQAINDFHSGGDTEALRARMRNEAVQVGAMALRFMLHLPAYALPATRGRWTLHVNAGPKRGRYHIEPIP